LKVALRNTFKFFLRACVVQIDVSKNRFEIFTHIYLFFGDYVERLCGA